MTFQSARAISLNPVVANVINQRRFVSIQSSGLVDETALNADAIGVSLEQSLANESQAIPVALLDGAILEVEASTAVTQGARVASDAVGRAVDAAGATTRVLGIALDAAAATGDVIRILGQKAAGEFTA